MITVEKLLFPGIGLGCLFLVLATSLITRPNIVLASAIETPPPQTAPGPAGSIPEPQPATPSEGQPTAEVIQPASAGTQAGAADGAAEVVGEVDELVSQEFEDCSLGGGFPDAVRQWCQLIDRYASEHGLDPNLVAAVMVQESGGNPQAYSKDGAVGLLQVMPRDGKAAGFQCINGPCFADRPSTDELFNPEFNVAYGARMLSGLIQKKGDVREALRAYGPMNMGYYYADLVMGIMGRYSE